MKIIRGVQEVLEWRRDIKDTDIGFVPTMGCLHVGHVSLIERARKENKMVAVSIFVNPIQFNNQEDLDSYPVTIEDDLKILRENKVDMVFIPEKQEIYPDDFNTEIDVKTLDSYLCGETRPGHFTGVCTVVNILLNLIRPAKLYLGEKDYQQLAILKTMVKNLFIPVEVIGCPIVREESGLALSSRNKRLSEEGRSKAADIRKTLLSIKEKLEKGRPWTEVKREVIEKNENYVVDYLEAVDLDTLQPVGDHRISYLVAMAVFIEGVRLIDNIKVVR